MNELKKDHKTLTTEMELSAEEIAIEMGMEKEPEAVMPLLEENPALIEERMFDVSRQYIAQRKAAVNIDSLTLEYVDARHIHLAVAHFTVTLSGMESELKKVVGRNKLFTISSSC